MEVLGAGFGRTGTHSLKSALEQLGMGPCHHMYEVRKRPAQVDAWLAIARGEIIDWDDVFDGFCSQADWPGSFYWRELAAHFPNAKVILTDRSPESWYRSISKTILPATEIGRKVDDDPVNRRASQLIYELALVRLFEGRLADREFAIQKFLNHRAEVIQTIPKERLLVFGLGDGWEPLCEFLGCEVPNTPFPNSNSTSQFIARKSYLNERE